MPIYHLTNEADLAAARVSGWITAASLASEGFVHCSQAHQVLRVVEAVFPTATELVLLCIDGVRLGASLKLESPSANHAPTIERFPHVYGPIPTAGVIGVGRLRRDAQGQMSWPTVWERL
jgi:uncharacterized protein (DUF952 family)